MGPTSSVHKVKERVNMLNGNPVVFCNTLCYTYSVEIKELVWTDKNAEHIARHNVSPHEVKEVIEGQALFLKAKLGRTMVIGKTVKSRTLAIILERIGVSKYFVVTARDADRKERKLFNEEIGGE